MLPKSWRSTWPFPWRPAVLFVLGLLYHEGWNYVAPTCLVFYGLALVNASKYTLTDIRYLGLLEIVLGCICMYYPHEGLYFWATVGFGRWLWPCISWVWV